jgi:hypothetical protein
MKVINASNQSLSTVAAKPDGEAFQASHARSGAAAPSSFVLRLYWVAQAAIAIAVLVLVELLHGGGGQFHAFQRAQFHVSLWCAGANLVFAALLSTYTRWCGWIREVPRILLVDTSISAFSLALAILPYYVLRHDAVRGYGVVMTLFVFGKIAACTVFACQNADVVTHRKQLLWFVFAMSLVAFGVLAPWYTLATVPQGDESHYMLLTYSLLHDHDWAVKNNYDQKNYVEQFPPPRPDNDRWYPYASQENDDLVAIPLDPHLVTNSRGEKLLWHDPGLSVIALPGYALGKRLGVELSLAVFAALVPVAMLEIALMLGAGAVPAIVTAIVFTFTPPIYPYSEIVVPELFGTVGILWMTAFFLKYREDANNRFILGTGIITAILPWICIRFWFLAGPLFFVFAAWILFISWPAWSIALKRLALLGLPSLVSLAIFAWFDHKYFDTFLPNGGNHLLIHQQTRVFWWRFDIAMLGMLFDRAFGLLPTAPLYIAAVAGFVLLFLRKKHWSALALFAPCAGYVALLCTSSFWDGGWCPPARYIMSGVALLAPAAALVVTRSTSRFLVILAGWTAMMDFIYTFDPFIRWPSPFHLYAYSSLMEYLHDRFHTERLYSALSFFPVMRGPRSQDYVMAYLWLAICVAAITWLIRKTVHKTAKRQRTLVA